MICNQNKTIGLFVCKLPEYFQRTLCGALAKEAKNNGYNLIIFSTFGEYENNQEYIDGESNLLEIPCYEQLDAIVLCLDVFDIPGMAEKLVMQVKEKARCPIISIRQKKDEFISILTNDKEAIISMVEHLNKNHKSGRIYYLSGPSFMEDICKREEGFREAVKKYNLQFREEYIYEGNLWYNVGKEAVDYFLQLEEELPDAIVCANDYMAIAVCEELSKRNICVPEDIIVTGFDDVEEASDCYPMISTVRACPKRFAEKAMEIILRSQKGEKIEKEYYISTENQYRTSCGCKKEEEEGGQFRRMFEKNHRLVHLYKQNMFMVFRMEGIRGFEGLPDLVGKFVEENTGVTDFYVCINPEEKYEYKESEKLPFEDRMQMLLHAYYGKKNTIEVAMSKKIFERTTLLPKEEIKEKPQIFYVNPLHYRKHCFGYAMIAFEKNCFHAGEDFYQSFIINICTVLENIYIQNQIEKLGDEKINLIRCDQVTGLLNQYGFHEVATGMLRDTIKNGKNCAFVLVRIDNLTEISEIYGRKEGDEALAQVAQIFEQFGKGKHIFGRISGNEFCLIFEEQKEEKMDILVKRLLHGINDKSMNWNKEYYIDVRCGWYIKAKSDVASVDECIRRAKIKMNMGMQMQKNMVKYVFEVMKYIRNNYYQDISVMEMANQIGVSRAYLSHCFKEIYQMSIQEYIIEFRMKKAEELLKTTDSKIRDVAFQIGYKDELYFSKVFKKRFGVSPKTFRDNL